MINIAFPLGSIAFGLTGAFIYEICRGHPFRQISKNYARAYAIIFLLYLLSLFTTPDKGHAFCDNCRRMSLLDQEYFVEQHKHHGEYAEMAFKSLKEIEAEHQYGIEDIYIATLSAGITACYLEDPRAIMVTIVLANAANYFNTCYDCHRRCIVHARTYRYHLFFCNAYAQQLFDGRIWCVNCSRLYKLYHYQGDIEPLSPTCKGTLECPHSSE